VQRSIRIEPWFGLLCVFPALSTVFVYAEAALARAALGHWPIPNVNDPKDLATWPLHFVSAAFVLGAIPALVFLTAIAVKNWRVLRAPSRYWFWLAVFAATCLSGDLVPTQIWQWWWD
jgi:hypothetical protein